MATRRCLQRRAGPARARPHPPPGAVLSLLKARPGLALPALLQTDARRQLPRTQPWRLLPAPRTGMVMGAQATKVRVTEPQGRKSELKKK